MFQFSLKIKYENTNLCRQVDVCVSESFVKYFDVENAVGVGHCELGRQLSATFVGEPLANERVQSVELHLEKMFRSFITYNNS